MIVGGVPLSVRDLHRIVAGWWAFRKHVRPIATEQNTTLNFLYFSYQPDFDILRLSLQTLLKVSAGKRLGKVFVVVDQKAPFSAAEEAALLSIYPKIAFMPVHNFSWGSAESTYAELRIFTQACKLLPNKQDMLIKVDSDILMSGWSKLVAILDSTLQAVGDGHFLQYRYAQGGFYMMRRRLIEDVLASKSQDDVEQVVKATGSVGEDVAISWLLKDAGEPFFFTRLMLFPDEYNRLERLNVWVSNEFIALHCHKDKHNMPALIDKFNLLENTIKETRR